MEVFPEGKKTSFSGNDKKKKILLFSMCGVFLFSIVTFFISKTVLAASAPSIITYQGKLLVSNSLATTTQSMYFILYDASSGGSALYTASGTVGVPQPLSITPSQGLFSVNLGDTGTNPIDPSVFQNNTSVYLEVRVGSDTLTPRKRITSVPYAFNSRYLDGVGVNTVSTSVYIPKSDANGNFTFNSTTVTTSTVTSLTVLGGASLSTISAGTWNGSVIGAVYGGTGQNSSAWTGLVRVTAGTWSTTTVALTTDVTGVLPIANGGTNSSTLAANGSLIYSDGTRYNAVAVGNSGYVLQSTGSGAPVWVATSSLGIGGGSSYTSWTLATSTDDIGYSVTSGVKVIFAGINGVTSTRSGATLSVGLENSGVTAGTYGSASAVPMLTIDAYGRVTSNATSSIAINGNQITSGVVSNIYGGTGQNSSAWTGLVRVTAGTWSTTTVALTTDVTGVLPIANGGTNSSTLAANGSLIYSDGTRYNAVAVGNSGYVLQSTGSGAPVWVATSSLGFGGNYINLQSVTTGTQQVGNFNISGTGIVGTSFGIGTSTVSSTLTVQAIAGVDPVNIVSSSGSSLLLVRSNGTAGINVNSPQAIFDVRDLATTSTGAIFKVANSAGTLSYMFVSSTATTIRGTSGAVNFELGVSTDNGSQVLIHGDNAAVSSDATKALVVNGRGALYLQAGGDNRLHINSAGLVGIGTISETSLLTIKGRTSENPFEITSSTGASLVKLLTNGNLGVGTSTPSQKLSVVGNISNIISGSTTISEVATLSISGSPSTIVVSGRYGYVTQYFGDSFSIIDFSNPTSPAIISTVSLAAGANPRGVAISGRYAYVANQSDGTLSIIDISNPTSPVQVATTSAGAGPIDVAIAGQYAYIGNLGNQLFVIDISNPLAPRMIATTTVAVGAGPQSLAISGKYLYTGNNLNSTMAVLDISNPNNPVLVGTTTVGSNPASIQVSGRYVYTSNSGASTISVVDVKNPAAPVQVATVAATGVTDIFLSGRYLYALNDTDDTLMVFDVSVSTSPKKVFETDVLSGFGLNSIYVSGRYAYIVNMSAGSISVLDISGTEVSSLIAHSAEVGNLQSRNDIFAQGTILAGTSLVVGDGGLVSQGSLSVFVSSTTGATSSIFNVGSGTFANILKVFPNGKIGINSSSPFATLSVNGDVALTGLYDSNGTRGSNGQILQTNGTSVTWVSTSSLGFSSGSDNGTVVTGTAGQFAYFATDGRTISGTSSLFVTSSGNVGVGTTSPLSKLTIFGSGVSNLFDVVSSSGSSLLKVLTNGNVGIGTSTPSQKLSVVGNISNTIEGNTTITEMSSTAVGDLPNAVFVSGKYAYTANVNSNNISVVDVTSPSSPVQVATTSVGSQPYSIYVSGRYAYTANYASSTISVVDVSNPFAPRQVATTSVGTNPYSIYVSGRYAYVANSGSRSISVVDVSNPFNPVQIATTSVGGTPIGIFVSGRYAYVVNNASNTISVVDISNPSAPIAISTTTLAGSPSPIGIYVSGRYAYTANSASNTISIIDISNPSAPSQVGFASVGILPISVYVSGRYAYVTDLNAGFSIVDVGNPTAPARVSTITVSAGELRSVFVSGRYAYVADSNVDALSVVDISGTEVSSLIAHSAEVGNLQSRNDIFAQGNIMAGTSLIAGIGGIMSQGTLSVFASSTGATSSIFNIASSQSANAFKIFANGAVSINTTTATSTLTIQASSTFNSILTIASSTGGTLVKILNNGNVGIGTSTPTQKLSVVGNISNIVDSNTSISLASSTGVGTTPFSVFVSGKYAYVANNGSNNISIVDVTNPSSPLQISTTTVDAGPKGIFVSGKYAYTANATSNTISVVDISNPRSSTQIASVLSGTGNTQPNSLYVSGKYLYVANTGNSTMSVIDIGNPTAPVLVASTTTGGSPISIYVYGRYAYIATLAGGTMEIYDISNPNRIYLVSSKTLGSQPHSVYVSGRYAYVTNYVGGYLSVVDVSNPASPTEVGSSTAFTNPRSVYVSGRYAYVADYGGSSVKIVDVGNPSAPVVLTTLSLGASPYNIFVSGRYAYTANNNAHTMSIVDISGTEVSSLIAHSAEVGNLQSRNDIFAQGNIMAGTSLIAGIGGIMSQGTLSVFASSTGATSSIFNIASSQSANAFKIFANGAVSINTTTATSTLTIQASSTFNSVLTIASSTGETLVKILNNGNVGIGTSTPTQKLSVVGNISNIVDANTAITFVSSTVTDPINVAANPGSVFVSGKYAYVANYGDNTISIIDISNPSAPVQIATTSVGTQPYGIYVAGRYAYTADLVSNAISVVDISNPRFPVKVGAATVGAGPTALYVSGQYAYVANSNSSSISVVDISNPTAPAQISTISVGVTPSSIYVSGRYAFTANSGSSTVSVVDISNPSSPVVVGTATTTVNSSLIEIGVSGRYLYTLDSNNNALLVIDVSNPSAPMQVATTSAGVAPNKLYISGRYAYVLSGSGTFVLNVIDISNPLAPRNIASTTVGGNSGLYVSGRYAYLTAASVHTFYIYDISGTEVSSLIAHSAEVGNLQSRNDIFAQGNIMAGTSLVVGAGGLMSNGALSVFASSTGATSSIFNITSAVSSSIFRVFANGKVLIGTSTVGVTSTLDVGGQVEVNLTSPTNATSALCHVDNGATNNQVIYDCNGTVSADYMEMYAADAGLQLGDVVVLSNNFVTTSDGNYIPKLSKSTSAYQNGLVGIISDSAQAGDFNSIGHNVSDSDNPLPLALAGRVRIKVTNSNGAIHVGDKLTSSNIAGVAMKATGEGPTVAVAMGDYNSAEVGTVMAFVNLNWNNNLYQALTVDTNSSSLIVGSISSPRDVVINGNISFGQTGIFNTLSFATSTLFESSVESFIGARAFTFNAVNFGSASDNYIISLRANNNPVFSVAANGDVHALGNYFGASAVLGTSTNPGDLAERVDIAADDTVEAGDVVMVDASAPDTYRRTSQSYTEAVAGVISTNPTIVVGNGKTENTAVMAMVGRVPVKVSAENGLIKKGDLLVSASLPGFAMKYDPTKDKNNKVVGIVGLALESLDTSSTGKVLALVRTAWVYNKDKDIEDLRRDIESVASGSSSSTVESLSVQGTGGTLSYTDDLNLQNHSLINVAGIFGKNNKWRIDEFGNLIQKITTVAGEKEIYGLQSVGKQEIVISGTSTLENGIKQVVLADLDQAIIDKTVPLKIQITMSGETNGVYVSERNYDSFTVKENNNGQSNAAFDWTVIAKVLSEDQAQPEVPVIDQSSGAASTDTSNTGVTSDASVASTSVITSSTETVAPAPEPAITETVSTSSTTP